MTEHFLTDHVIHTCDVLRCDGIGTIRGCVECACGFYVSYGGETCGLLHDAPSYDEALVILQLHEDLPDESAEHLYHILRGMRLTMWLAAEAGHPITILEELHV